MTTGEKIKFYRTLKEISQKTLAEQSGVSEISIRKYEAGDRNAKPEQLQKIADALNLKVARLLDIKDSMISMDTVGDVMSAYFLMEKTAGATIQYDIDANNQVNLSTVAVKFQNRQIMEQLEHLALLDNMAKRLDAEIKEESGADAPQAEGWQSLNALTLEETKQNMSENIEPLIFE